MIDWRDPPHPDAGMRPQPTDIRMKATRPATGEDFAALARTRAGLTFGAERLKALAAELERYDRAIADAGWPDVGADPVRDHEMRLKRARRP